MILLASCFPTMPVAGQSNTQHSTDAVTHNNLGIEHAREGRYREAIEAYRRALTIQPDLAEAHFNLGTAFHKSGRFDEAIASLKRAIALQPEWPDAHYNLGMVYLMLKDRNAAIAQHRLLRGINESLANQFLERLYKGAVISVKPK